MAAVAARSPRRNIGRPRKADFDLGDGDRDAMVGAPAMRADGIIRLTLRSRRVGVVAAVLEPICHRARGS